MGILRPNLPSVLTLSRIVLIPFFVFTAGTKPIVSAIVFSIASLTDFLDGYLARRTGQITKFGIIMDPLADKLLVISALFVLVDMGRLSVWIAILLTVREFLVTGLRVVALSKDIVIPAEMGGKLKTTAQITAILCLLLVGTFFDNLPVDLYDIGYVVIIISVVLSVFSGIKYTTAFWRRI